MTIMSRTLQSDRHEAAQEAYEAYDFGCSIEDHDGWDAVIPGNSMSRNVYIESEPGGPVERVGFTVCFAPDTAEVVECYALDGKGNLFGTPAPRGSTASPAP